MATQIDTAISSINEESIFTTLGKIVKGKISSDFYITVYHGDKRIRSRSLSNNKNLNNQKNQLIEKYHQKLKDEIGITQDNLIEGINYSEEIKIYGIKIGKVIFIVSNSDLLMCKIFTHIICVNFILQKSSLLIKEGPNFSKYHQFVKSNVKNIEIIEYIKNVSDLSFGKIGNH